MNVDGHCHCIWCRKPAKASAPIGRPSPFQRLHCQPPIERLVMAADGGQRASGGLRLISCLVCGPDPAIATSCWISCWVLQVLGHNSLFVGVAVRKLRWLLDGDGMSRLAMLDD